MYDDCPPQASKEAISKILKEQESKLKPAHLRLMAWVDDHGGKPCQVADIGAETDMGSSTVRRHLTHLESLGLIVKGSVRIGSYQGLLVKLTELGKKRLSTELSAPTERSIRALSRTSDFRFKKTDQSGACRLRSLSKQDFEALFPSLVEVINFSFRDLQKVIAVRGKIEDDLGYMLEYFEYANWELEQHGNFVRDDGTSPDCPIKYFMGPMQKAGGSWRKPKGYLSAKERVMAEERARIKTIKREQDELYAEWVSTLSPNLKVKIKEKYLQALKEKGTNSDPAFFTVEDSYLKPFWRMSVFGSENED